LRIEYTAPASNDLDDIRRYYAERVGADAAEKFVLRIMTTLERLLARNPRIGRRRSEFGFDTRSFRVLPYVVFYRSKGSRVQVRRILHGHRDVRPPLASLLVAV
jgi:plasmid stabilization system protein ParE